MKLGSFHILFFHCAHTIRYYQTHIGNGTKKNVNRVRLGAKPVQCTERQIVGQKEKQESQFMEHMAGAEFIPMSCLTINY